VLAFSQLIKGKPAKKKKAFLEKNEKVQGYVKGGKEGLGLR